MAKKKSFCKIVKQVFQNVSKNILKSHFFFKANRISFSAKTLKTKQSKEILRHVTM